MAKKKDVNQNQQTERKPSTARMRPALYIFSVVILVIVVVTFVGAPVVSGTASQTSLTFGRYGNREITYAPGNYFARQYETIAAQFDRDAGSDNLEAELRLIWRQAFNQAMLHAAIMEEAEASGLSVSESAVDEMLAQDPQFQVDGVFSPERYRRTSSQERFSLRNFYRETLIHQKYLDDMLTGGQFSGEEIAFLKSMGSPERQFRGATLAFADFPASEVVAYGEENREIFRRANLSVITVGDQDEAERILLQIEDRSSSFEELARAHSADRFAEQGGDAGWVYVYQLSRDFEGDDAVEEILSLETGEVSPVMEGINGWVIYRLDDGPLEIDLETQEGVATVRQYMNAFERGVIEDYLLAAMQSFREVAGTGSFASAAGEIGADVFTTDFFPVNYGNLPYYPQVSSPDTEILDDAAFRQSFLEEAFSIDEGDLSEPVVLRDNVVVLQLLEEREAEEDSMGFLDSFYPFLLQQFRSEDLQRRIIDPDLVEDNFNQAFNRYILGS
ncbi:MAG: SurA N-terminal domain-containing protein [Spirochaetaceae bacterium]